MRRLASGRARAVLDGECVFGAPTRILRLGAPFEVSWKETDKPLADNTVITFKGGCRGSASAAAGAGLEDEIRRL